jgi:hypothetical protein
VDVNVSGNKTKKIYFEMLGRWRCKVKESAIDGNTAGTSGDIELRFKKKNKKLIMIDQSNIWRFNLKDSARGNGSGKSGIIVENAMRGDVKFDGNVVDGFIGTDSVRFKKGRGRGDRH